MSSVGKEKNMLISKEDLVYKITRVTTQHNSSQHDTTQVQHEYKTT